MKPKLNIWLECFLVLIKISMMRVITISLILLGTANCLVMNCDFRMEYTNDWKKQFSCILQKFVTSMEKGNFTVLGSDTATENNVTQFLARQVNVEQFPEGLGNKFSRLEAVRFASCNMQLMLKNDLIGLNSLKYLDLIANKLEYIKSDVFELAPNLEEVILNNNRIQYIGYEIMKPLTKLKKISFGGNICVASHAHESEEDLERLKEEIAIKCSDVTMSQMITKIKNLESKIHENSKMLEEILSLARSTYNC